MDFTNLFGDLDLLEQSPLFEDSFTAGNGDQDERDGPLSILRPSTLQLLSTMLNPVKIIPSDSGLPRDWRGLAELAGVTGESMSYLEMKGNPLQELLKMLPTVSNSRLKTVKDLKAFLAIIDRYDVVDDGESLLESDVAVYRNRANQLNANSSKSPTVLDHAIDRDLLTYDDRVGEERRRYDAFILYADEDSEFADEVITKLETEYDLRLCVKERDLLPGVMFEHEAVGKLIEQRCNRLLVIFSPSFLESEGNKFLVSFTQALALESRQRKIIPCMYKRCDLPMSVRYSFCLDYNRAGKLWNFWEKLSQSISTVRNGSTNQPIRNSTASPSSFIETGTSLPDFSYWDSKKGEDTPLAPFDSLPSTPLDDLPFSSSLPKHSYKSNSKKWYKKVLGSGTKKKKKQTENPGKLLATAD